MALGEGRAAKDPTSNGFELTESTRSAVSAWIERTNVKPKQLLFPSRLATSPSVSTRQYAWIVHQRVYCDEYAHADLWGEDLNVHLFDVYSERARYTVMFISSYYRKKLWIMRDR